MQVARCRCCSVRSTSEICAAQASMVSAQRVYAKRRLLQRATTQHDAAHSMTQHNTARRIRAKRNTECTAHHTTPRHTTPLHTERRSIAHRHAGSAQHINHAQAPLSSCSQAQGGLSMPHPAHTTDSTQQVAAGGRVWMLPPRGVEQSSTLCALRAGPRAEKWAT